MKKNIKHILYSLLFLLSSTLISAQEIIAERTYNEFIRLNNEKSIGNHLLTENDIAGSPYLNQEFITGNLLTTDNVLYKDIPLRYNIYNDEMEFKTGEDNYLAISNPTTIKEFRIGNNLFIYSNKKNKRGDHYGYYQVLNNGNIKLLLQYNISFVDKKEPEPYKSAQPPKFQKNANTYYFKLGAKEPQEISSKKDLQTIFGSESSKMEAFIKKEKLNVRNEADLIELIKFINESKKTGLLESLSSKPAIYICKQLAFISRFIDN